MSTQAQITANRLNAQLSTGPRTPGGKAISSSNALRHGFSATRLVIPPDEAASFEAYRAALIADTHPEGAVEEELFDRLLLHGWSLRRVRAAEAQLVVDTNAEVSDPAVEHRLALLARYRRDLERSYDRALKEIARRQTERAVLLQQEPEAISKIYQTTPLANVTEITNNTEPLFAVTQAVAQQIDMAPSRELAHRAYTERHNAYLARKAAAAAPDEQQKAA